MPPSPSQLPIADDDSKDTLNPIAASDEDLRGLLTPRPAWMVPGVDWGASRPQIGLGRDKVTCSVSVSDAILEDRG